MKMSHQYVIRAAKPEDCEDIVGLLQEFCASTEVPDKTSITAKALQEDGFGKNPFFHGLVVETNSGNTSKDSANVNDATIKGQVVGYALYYFGYSTWHGKLVFLEDVYLSPDHRDAGLGTTLMRRVAKIAANVGCNRMQWFVLSMNEGARRLYDRIGGEDLTDSDSGYHVITLRKDKFSNFVNQDQSNTDLYFVIHSAMDRAASKNVATQATVTADACSEPEFKCDNANNPQKVQWYTEVGNDLGQWYLSLNDGNWVYQPAQNGQNKFLVYQFEPSIYGDGEISMAQIQTDDNNYNSDENNCVAAESNSKVEAVDFPETFLQDWVPLDGRFFDAIRRDDHWVLGSLQYPGYCISYDSSNLNSSSKDPLPVILVKDGEPNWDNRYFKAVDSGRQDGTPEYRFR